MMMYRVVTSTGCARPMISGRRDYTLFPETNYLYHVKYANFSAGQFQYCILSQRHR